LNKLLKKLPDETVSDLLPAKDTDITGDKSGQLLNVLVLDLIVEAQGQKHSKKEILKLAQLQPLNLNRINTLLTFSDKDIKPKANDIIKILQKKGLNPKKGIKPNINNQALPDKILNTAIKHPALQKKGSFYSLQKWLSKIKTDDYQTVKEYTEKISKRNHGLLFDIIENTKTVYGLSNLETYITKGQKSFGIIAYQGTPPYMIIGHDHLNETSDVHLSPSMLQFALASEMAYLYFKHSKISSNDVWRGVFDKGSVLIDTLLTIVPAAGILGKSVQNVSKLTKLTMILKAADRILKSGKNIYNTALKFSDFYVENYKSNSKIIKEHQLLAASKLVQYTSDRAGLALCGDLNSAVNAIFRTGTYTVNLYGEAAKTSLKDLLLKENFDGTYKNQELALRLANLFSFYLSDAYESVRESLLNG
jgi:hypothetical protein